jgi:hypothetical protein
MVMTSPALTRRAPPTATPLMLTRLSGAASNSQRVPADRRVVSSPASAGDCDSTSARMAPVTWSNTTRPPYRESSPAVRSTIDASNERDGSMG